MEQWKREKLEEEEDRISYLPDSIIHHILSCLRSTEYAIQTEILSKQWRNQWTHVPVLIFDFQVRTSYFSDKGIFFISRSIDQTLRLHHNCFKIKTFHLRYPYNDTQDSTFDHKIRFAIGKDAEDLILDSVTKDFYLFPQCLFNNASSLVKLIAYNGHIMLHQRVNWGSLRSLQLHVCKFNDQAVEHILSATPLLESLVLVKIQDFGSREVVIICSQSLKRLVLEDVSSHFDIEISCPNLEQLTLKYYFNFRSTKFVNLPSSLCATLNFHKRGNFGFEYWRDDNRSSTCEFRRDILQQLHHIKELSIGSTFMRSLLERKEEGMLSRVLNIKCLTLDSPNLYKDNSKIAFLLGNSPLLEELVIIVDHQYVSRYPRMLNVSRENHWNSDTVVFECLASHLRTIKIAGFPERDDMSKLLCDLVQFLFKNAKVLEKTVLDLKYEEKTFKDQVSQYLSSFPTCSQHVTMEVI